MKLRQGCLMKSDISYPITIRICLEYGRHLEGKHSIGGGNVKEAI